MEYRQSAQTPREDALHENLLSNAEQTKTRLKLGVQAGTLSEEEYKEITGEEYKSE